MSAILSAKWLVTSGCLAIFLSSLFGILLLTPSVRTTENAARLKQLGKAHVDWILLGLMSVAAGTLAWLHDLNLHPGFVALILFGAWTNPLPYVFRAYGIDAFQFAGGLSQRSSAALAALSVAAVLIGWWGVFVQVARTAL
jgi:hypothetical protein